MSVIEQRRISCTDLAISIDSGLKYVCVLGGGGGAFFWIVQKLAFYFPFGLLLTCTY